MTRVLSCATFSIALSLSGIAVAPDARAEVVRTAYTSIVAASSGKCLDITGASSTPGAAADQWRCSLAPNQQWTVQPFNGSYRVIEQQTGQCLAVDSGSTTAGAQIVQNTCSGANAELWSFPPVGGGFQLVSKNSGLCANVSAASATDGAKIVQSACSTGAGFVWVFASGLMTPSALVDLQAGHSGQCLNVSGASRSAGANVIQWPCSGAQNEQWSFVQSGSAFQVVSKNSGLCLAVSGASTTAGANIIQTTCSTASDRLWTLTAAGHAYQLVAQNSGLCLDVNGASQTAGAQVIQWTCHTAQNQQWSFSPATIPSTWSNLITLAVNPIAMANLPNGKILMWSANSQFNFEGDIGSASGQTFTGIFDPATGNSTQVVVTNTGDDMFCPGTANLFDGRILVNGGSSSPKTSIYNPSTDSWSADARMNIARGYEGDTVLSSGSVFTLGGSWSGGQGNKNGEIWTSGTGWRNLPSVTAAPITGPDPQGVYRGDNHLWLFATANGGVFHAGPSAQMHWITTAGNGSITSAGNRGDDPYAINGKAVLYDVGLIMKTGGAPAYQDTDATTSTYLININGGVTVTKLAPMAYRRAFANGVVLPNGQIVIAGGQTHPVPFSDDTSIFIAEIWDPDTRVFRQLKAEQAPRNYHSSAILMRDGRVLVGGGGQCGGCSTNHLNAEILTPPYLLNPDGSAAARPSITSAPATATLGSSISVTTDSPVMSFVMMRLSSVTHTVNNDQRRVPLVIQSTSGATSYALAIPSDPGIALPGYYMLFALNPQGVPSTAATLRVQ
jgi:galactose oxidase